MKKLLVLILVAIGGCDSMNVEDQPAGQPVVATTPENARELCRSVGQLNATIDTWFIYTRTDRDNGFTKSFELQTVADACGAADWSDIDIQNCINCGSAIVDEVFAEPLPENLTARDRCLALGLTDDFIGTIFASFRIGQVSGVSAVEAGLIAIELCVDAAPTIDVQSGCNGCLVAVIDEVYAE